jgi:hypothetical protein
MTVNQRSNVSYQAHRFQVNPAKKVSDGEGLIGSAWVSVLLRAFIRARSEAKK